MKERPILFSAPMIKALLSGAKTQTRRIVKRPLGIDCIEPALNYPGEWVPWVDGDPQESIFCPYGLPGDRLWVRENFRVGAHLTGPPSVHGAGTRVWFEADAPHHMAETPGKLHPAIHLPRWACRLRLLVTDVRAEPLNRISELDALNEGVVWSDRWNGFVVPGLEHPNKDFPVLSRATAREQYAALWDVINGSGEWLANPWVWAVSFEVVK